MKKALTLTLIAACSLAKAGPIPAGIRAQYRAERRILAARNWDAFTALAAADYTYVKTDGKVLNRKDSLAEFKQVFNAKKIVFKETFAGAVKHGDTYDVTFDSHMKLIFKDKKVVRVHEIGVDTWKKIGGRWQVTKTIDKVSEQK